MTMIMEVSPLEGIDLEGSPPCQMWMQDKGDLCGEPSVFRIRSFCTGCDFRAVLFICKPCRDLEMIWMCSKCLSPAGIERFC